MCGLLELRVLCGALKFKFTISETNKEITEFPHKSLFWENNALKLTLNPISDADLGDHSITMKIYSESHSALIQVVTISYNIAPASTVHRNL